MAFWQIVKASQLKNEKKKPTFFCVVKTGVVLQVRCLVVRLVVEEKLLSSTAAMFLLSQCACDVCVCVCLLSLLLTFLRRSALQSSTRGSTRSGRKVLANRRVLFFNQL